MSTHEPTVASTKWGPLATPVHDVVPELEHADFPWRDNAFLSWWDVGSQTCGILHFATSPNTEGRRARASVAAAGQTTEIIEPLSPGTFKSRSMTVDLERDARVDHPDLEVHLEQEPLYSPIDFTTSRAVPGLSEEYPLSHYQQVVRTRGSIRRGDDTHEFEGVGWRDRTWGFRDESVSWGDYTCACLVLEDHAVVLYKVIDAEGVLRSRAWRIDDAGQHTLGDFSFVRNASGLLAKAIWDSGARQASATTTHSLGGFWNPLGPDRHAGPTCSVYDEFLELRTTDGAPASGLIEHGIIRKAY